MKNLYLTYKNYCNSVIAGLLLAIIISNGVDIIKDERYFMSTKDIQHNKIKVDKAR